MSRKKHTPARPHWERIAARKPNNKVTVHVPETSPGYWHSITTYKTATRPSAAKPGQF